MSAASSGALPTALPVTRALLPTFRAAVPSRVPPTAAVALGWVALATVGAVLEPLTCTDAAPCGPDWYGAAVVALLLAVVAWCCWLPRVALLASVPLGVALLLDATRPPGLPAAAVAGGLALLAAVGVVATRVLDGHRRSAADLVDAAPHAVWPGGRVPVGSRGRSAAGLALLAAALGCLAYGVLDQRGEAARERSAARVPATVTAVADDGYSVVVAPADGGAPLELETLDAGAVPVGSSVTVLRGDGFDRLAAEPYDASSWLVLAGLLAAVGGSLVTVARRREADERAAYERPQPVFGLAAVPLPDEAVLVPADVPRGPGALSRLTVRVAPLEALPAAGADEHEDEEAYDAYDDDDEYDDEAEDEELDRPVAVERIPVVVFGLPLPGRYVVALTEDGRAVLPVGPTRRVPADWAPPFEPALPPAVPAVAAAGSQPPADPGPVDDPDAVPPTAALDALLAPSPWRARWGGVLVAAGLAWALLIAVAVASPWRALLALGSAAELVAVGCRALTSGVRAGPLGLVARSPSRVVEAPWRSLAGADVVDRVLVLRTRTGRLLPLPAVRLPLGRGRREAARRRLAAALEEHLAAVRRVAPDARATVTTRPRAAARAATAAFALVVVAGVLLRDLT